MRLASFRDKLQVYFLGLLTGLVLGGGFFVLKLDEYVRQFTFDKEITGNTDKEEPANDKENTDKKKTDSKNKKSKKDRTISYTADSASGPYLDGDTLAADSIGSPPSVLGRNSDDEIVVRKDELVAQRNVALVDLDGVNPKDSAIQKLSGIRDPQTKALQVEFWRSPLNYKGYKMSKNKLVLFGLESEDEVVLYKVEEDIYMKNRQGVFRLEVSADFRQPERVSDASLIARLK